MLATLWRKVRGIFGRARLARELDEEIRGHYDELRLAFEEEGHDPAEAARRATLRLGSRLLIREVSEEEWRLSAFGGFGQDLRLSGRALRRRPGFAAAAVSTLALGIGASTAMFSVAYGVSIRPLPYREPDRLIRIYESHPANNEPRHDVSDRAFQAWREGSPSLQVAAFLEKPTTRTLVRPGRHRVVGRNVTPAFFELLGVRPYLGPGFRPEAEYRHVPARDVVLSYDAWQRVFNGRSDIIGTRILWATDEDEFQVVGVLPKDFAFGEPVDAWLPDIIPTRLSPNIGHDRDGQVVARLINGTSIDRARAELETVATRLAEDAPTVHGGWTVTVESLQASIVGTFRRWTWLLFTGVAVVLLVACLNIGALLVARAVSRERETAVRIALGSNSWRLVRFWLAEALAITGAGTSVGLLLAWLAMSALKAAAPPGIPRLEAIALDAPVLAVVALSAVLAVVVFTVAPVRWAAERDVSHGLRSSSAGAGENRTRHATRSWLSAAQCAGAAMLAVIAVMLTRSFVNLMAFDLGWDSANVVSLQVDPAVVSEDRRPWYARVEWSDRLIDQLQLTPGIARAAITTQLPLTPEPASSSVARGRERPSPNDPRWPAVSHQVTNGYFEVMGIRPIAGRLFDDTDRFSAAEINRYVQPDHGVAIVTEQTARTLWPGESAIGQAIQLDRGAMWRQIVGVVEDIQFYAVGETPALHVFLPWTQDSAWFRPYLFVKTTVPVRFAIPMVREMVASTKPGAEVNEIVQLDDMVARATAQPRFASRLIAMFGVLALGLAAVGIYGTLSYLVSARTREIGIRLALGASRRSVLSNVVSRGLVPAVGGGLVGVLLASATARVFGSLFFRIEPLDPASFAGGVAALLVVALLAAWGPALKAARIDPVRALRTE